jgi:hypothetical protein
MPKSFTTPWCDSNTDRLLSSLRLKNQAGIRFEPSYRAVFKGRDFDPGFGVDGTCYELILGGHFIVESRFKWWCNAPRGWETLSGLFREIEALVENTITAGN